MASHPQVREWLPVERGSQLSTFNSFHSTFNSSNMRNRLFSNLFLAMLTTLSAHAQQDSVMVGTRSDDVLPATTRQDSVPCKRMRVDGFRVQVYYGGNNHKSKLQAQRMAERAKIWFEEQPVYTSFASPHWICRVGDFQSREEAMELLNTMRESGRFPMAVIVKSRVNVFVNEYSGTEQSDSGAARDTAACKENLGATW